MVSGLRQDDMGMKKKEEVGSRQDLKYSKTSCTEKLSQGSRFHKNSTQQGELIDREVDDVLRVACFVSHNTNLRPSVF